MHRIPPHRFINPVTPGTFYQRPGAFSTILGGRGMKRVQKRLVFGFTILCLLVVGIWGNGAEAMKKQKEKKVAILLTAFGTSIPEAQAVFHNVEKMAKERFPDKEIRWAYTSSIIRKKLASQGQILHSPETALAQLMEDGYTHVAVLSLHFIPGEEFHGLVTNARLFEQMVGGFDRVVVARPLLSSYDDFKRVVEAVMAHMPKSRKPEDAVLLMGHGSEKHPADAIYAAVDGEFKKKDPLIFVATVEGHPSLDDVIPALKKSKVKKVFLMPFMSVAGDHARNDMAGDNPDSWKSILTREGYEVIPVLEGMAGYPEIVTIWLDHLEEAMKEF